jgi:predicted DCC family thiol-disulfide oxidoreductase YuxK
VAEAVTGSLSDRLAKLPEYSFRDDGAIPRFDDGRPLIVFDGVCVLCSRSMRFIARHDRDQVIQFTAAQSNLGQALFRHYGLNPENFETFLFVEDGRAVAKFAAVLAVARHLRRPWNWLQGLWIVPGLLGDWLYDRFAGNRYRLFGRYDTCFIPDAAWRSRVIP